MRKLLGTLLMFLIVISAAYAFPASQYFINGTAALVPALYPKNTLSTFKGMLGEYITESDMTYISRLEKTKWKSVNPRTKSQGLDHLFVKFNENDVISDVMVIESKFRQGSLKGMLKNTLKGKQMSYNWVKDRVDKDILPVYRNIKTLDESGSVVVSSHRPQKSKIVDDSIIYIGNDSFYYRLKGDEQVRFYDGTGSYIDKDSRSSRLISTTDAIESYIDKNIYRKLMINYQIIDGNLYEEKADIISSVGSDDVILENKPKRLITRKSEIRKILDSDIYKANILEQYGLADVEFIDDGFDIVDRLNLLNKVDTAVAKKILSSKANIRILNQRFGLNLSTPLNKFEDIDWTSVLKAKNISSLDPAIARRFKHLSRISTLKTSAGFGAIGFAAGLVGEILHNGSFENINWTPVTLTTGTMTLGSIAGRGVEILGTQIANKSGKIISQGFSNLSKMAPLTLGIFADTAIDSIFTLYMYSQGIYSLNQTLAVAGMNLATNAVIAAGSTWLSSAVAGAIGGSWGGPIGIGVGFGFGLVVAAGTNFIIDPITNKIELSNTFDILSSSSREQMVKDWSLEFLSTQDF